MELKFFARAGHCVPYGTRAPGHVRRYVGRAYEGVNDKEAGVVGRLVASKEPQVIAETDPQFADIVWHAKQGGLWAADKATADFIGVEFVAVEVGRDGEFAPKVTAQARKAERAEGGIAPQG